METEWAQIKAEYLSTNTSYRQLAKKYEVSFSTLGKRATRENWKGKKKQVAEKADMKAANKIAAAQAKQNVSLDKVADMLINRIETGVADGTLLVDTAAFKHLTSALRDLKDIKGIKSDADMREQEARIEKLRRESVQEEKNSEIRVVLSSEIEGYSE